MTIVTQTIPFARAMKPLGRCALSLLNSEH